jgi:hypothetical protein
MYIYIYNLGAVATSIAAKYQVPCIMTGFQPDINSKSYKLPDDQNTSFLMLGSTVRTFQV